MVAILLLFLIGGKEPKKYPLPTGCEVVGWEGRGHPAEIWEKQIPVVECPIAKLCHDVGVLAVRIKREVVCYSDDKPHQLEDFNQPR